MLMQKNYNIMSSFNLKTIPSLDVCVLGSLELLSRQNTKKISFGKRKRALIIGSGNALATGRIVFKKSRAIYANESNYKLRIKNQKIDIAFLISASGAKHSIQIARALKRKNIRTILLTNNVDAPAKKFVNDVMVFPKQREPYTYNTSTYFSMILSETGEDVDKIYEQIKKIDKIINKHIEQLKKSNSIYMILPSEFEESKEMLITKFDELFGPNVSVRIYTAEQTKHAKTLVSSDDEFFISFRDKNILFGKKKNRIHIPLSAKANFVEILSVGYYLIGKIQDNKPDYFKNNLVNYCKEASRMFNQNINPIVN